MRLRNVQFSRVWCSSGARGFFGDGYWYHKWLKLIGLDYGNSTFVAKTTTFAPRKGNMPLKEDKVSPKDFLPACIKVKPVKGLVLNSVGLSGPGAVQLLCKNKWQNWKQPFLISFMSVEATAPDRVRELIAFADLLRQVVSNFQAPVGLEINFSCPNAGVSHSDLADEVWESLGAASIIGIPLVPNFGPDVDAGTLLKVASHPKCDAVSIANTLKWGSLPDKVDWETLWGQGTSPLKHLGGGGMSGYPLLPLVRSLVSSVRREGMMKPIVAGGGVMSKADAFSLLQAGADAVKLGTIGMLRPWRVKGIVRALT